MKTFVIHFVSYNGSHGREVAFTLTIDAATHFDAGTVAERMTEVMGWRVTDVVGAE